MTPEQRDDWIEERAAVRQYEGGYPRHIAERLAREDYARMMERRRAQDEAQKVARVVNWEGSE